MAIAAAKSIQTRFIFDTFLSLGQPALGVVWSLRIFPISGKASETRMTPDSHKDELARARAAVIHHRFATTILCLSLLLSIILNFRLFDSARTIVTPPVIDRAFWVSGNKVSAEYLELMGPFVAQMILDISTQSAAYKRDMLLRFVLPSASTELRIRMDKEAARLGTNGATTAFRIARVTANADSLSVRMDGTLSTYINGKTYDADTSYVAQFKYDSGTLWLDSFEATGK